MSLLELKIMETLNTGLTRRESYLYEARWEIKNNTFRLLASIWIFEFPQAHSATLPYGAQSFWTAMHNSLKDIEEEPGKSTGGDWLICRASLYRISLSEISHRNWTYFFSILSPTEIRLFHQCDQELGPQSYKASLLFYLIELNLLFSSGG